MSRKLAAAITLFLSAVLSALASEPPDRALEKARRSIAAGEFSDAVTTLEAALPHVGTLPADVQPRARTALHFYAAVAYSGLRRDREALEHIERVLQLSPDIRAVDPAKYDQRFVTLFEQTRSKVAVKSRFAALYPVFSPAELSRRAESSDWRGYAAVEILATRAERRQWKASVSQADRSRFFAEFWRIRDRTPDTEKNEYRDLIEHRVSIADAAFSLPGERGALTDRGYVFILLGEPAYVQRRALGSSDVIQSMNVGSIGIQVGTVEYWFYTHEQLPLADPKPTTTYRFFSHQGVGDYVLQKDGVAMHTLDAVARTSVKK